MNTACGSEQKWRAGTLVRNILITNSGLTSLVGEDIFPIIAPVGTLGNFIVYRRDKYAKEYTKTCVINETCQVIVSAVADDYDTAIDIAEMIDNTLTGTHTTEDGKRFNLRLLDASEDFNDNKYVEALLFEIN